MMKNIGEKLKKFRPPLVTSCILAPVFSAASLILVTTDFGKAWSVVIPYAIYVCAAVFLSLAVWALVILFREASPGNRLRELAHRTEFTGRLVDNEVFRTITFTHASLALNIVFAVAKGVAGWFSASWWLITLSAYYLLLCAARFLLLKDSRKLDQMPDQSGRSIREWKAYRVCGALLLAMTLILFGIVILIMTLDSKFTYHGTLIFAVALWDFYCLTSAIVYMVRNRLRHTPIVMAIKNIKLAAALVSMLSLQTAMFASFGADTGTAGRRWMNLATGSAVSLMIFALGLSMVARAVRRVREIYKTEVSP